jgi:hypothetical protein
VLRAGQSFTIAASGAVNLWPECAGELDEVRQTDPDMSADYCAHVIVGPAGDPVLVLYPDNPAPSLTTGALLGRVGRGDPFYVGTGGTFTARSDGLLRFALNDWDFNNEGAFTVVITVGGATERG